MKDYRGNYQKLIKSPHGGSEGPKTAFVDELDEAKYPEEWDIEYFKSLPSFKKRVEYAKEKLGKVGSGSARIVFSIDDETVFKLAKNNKGLAQNDLEADISGTSWYDFVTKVYDHGPDKLWIEAEKARKMRKSDFKRLVGYKFDDWADTLMSEYSQMTGQRGGALYAHAEEYEEIVESDLFQEILSFIADYEIMPGDFARISSWGIVNRDGEDVPVLTDYGISKSIYKDYYVGPIK